MLGSHEDPSLLEQGNSALTFGDDEGALSIRLDEAVALSGWSEWTLSVLLRKK